MMSRLLRWPYWRRALLCALAAFVMTALCERSDVFRRFDLVLSDAHGRYVAPKVNFDGVVVIDVDEDSITQLQRTLGPWPYDREIYALVVSWLQRAGVRAVGFDILFAEARKGDDALADMLDGRVVLAAAALPYTLERDAAYRLQLRDKTWGAALPALTYPLPDLTLPRAPLTQRAGIGVISAALDRDGILRRVPLVFGVYDRLAPGMALALAYAGRTVPPVTADDGRISMGSQSWPVSARGEALLRYPAGLDGLRTIPFYQVALAASGVAGLESLAASLKDKVVLIGSSSAGLGDYVETPIGRHPGTRVQAMATVLLAGGHVLQPRTLLWDLALAVSTMALVLLLGRTRWHTNTSVQWLVFPLVLVFIGIFSTLLLTKGQAVGLLFAISAGVLTHLAIMLFRQVQLFHHNQQLETEKRAAQQADALKSQFLSHITHELRTPLTAIMGFNNINWRDSDIGRDLRMKNSEIVDRNCQHMLSLVNNLLDQAKIEAGQLSIQPHPDKLRPVVQDAVATVRPLLSGKPVKIVTDDIGVPEVLEIDAFRLRQIVLNLLSNAIKFTEKGEISVVTAWHDGELTLSVVDTGPGMPPAAVARLFTAFQQADAGVAARHGGTGLGLTISRNLARLMGGDIKVHSALGKGTTFTVTVAAPVVQAGVGTQTAPAARRESAATALQGRVLLAEDMPDTRALVERHLTHLGLTVLQAENGEQAIEMTLRERPDVVLMDMDMPIIGGVEATRTLRMCGFSAPVLALTAHKSEHDRNAALGAGCNGVIEKPLTRASLHIALAAALAPRATAALSTASITLTTPSAAVRQEPHDV